MRCPNCQAEVREGAAFCGSCGAAIPAAPETPVPEVPAPETPAPEVPAPETPAPEVPAPETPAAAPQPEPSAPAPAPTAPLPAPTAPLPAPAPAPQYPAAVPPDASYAPVGVPQPPKKRKTGLIIAIVAIALLLLCGCVVGGVALFMPWGETIEEVTGEPVDVVPAEPGDAGAVTETPAGPAGFSLPEEAVAATLADEGIADWVYQVYEESEQTVVYWAGPPASEFATEIVVGKNADGSWSVVSIEGLDFGGDVPEGELSPMDQAINVVGEHLYAVKEDRGLDAQSYTVDPFRSDSASAQVSNGAFQSFEVTEAAEQSDGSFWVRTVQNWTWGQEQWEYWVVPTELGYYIADVRPW